MEIKTPYHLINTDKLLMNLNGPIAKIRNNASCNILLALKGFSSPQILSFMKDGIDGISASGYNEAILGRKTINKHVCTYSPIYTKETIKTIATYSDNIVFNSIEMFSKYHKIAQDRDCSCGIRINPEYSSLPLNSKTNACRKNSRLGITFENMPSIDLFCKKQIEGIHVHNMCEQFTDSLEETIDYIIDKYDPFLKRIKWLNLGGGQLYAHKEYNIDQAIQVINKLHNLYDFDVYLEPCYGIMINTGFLLQK